MALPRTWTPADVLAHGPYRRRLGIDRWTGHDDIRTAATALIRAHCQVSADRDLDPRLNRAARPLVDVLERLVAERDALAVLVAELDSETRSLRRQLNRAEGRLPFDL